MKVLRVNMHSLTINTENLPQEWSAIGGSGLIAKIMNAEVPPDADPLGPQNKLLIACGPLAGTLAPQLGRVSVGAKSPLTYGIKEANSGGPAAQYLDRLGFRAIVVENAATQGGLFYLKITKDGADLLPADKFRGLKNYALVEQLHSDHSSKVAVICIGIARERMYRGASVSFTDTLGDPSRNAGRGGLGAVMGSKGLKAILIDPSGAPSIGLVDNNSFKRTVKSWIHTITHDVGCGLYAKYGTPFAVANSANQGTLPPIITIPVARTIFTRSAVRRFRKSFLNAAARCTGACRAVWCNVPSSTRMLRVSVWQRPLNMRPLPCSVPT